MIQAARDCLRDAKESLRPAPAEQRLALLASLADVLGLPDALRSNDRARIAGFWKAYHDDLDHLPAEVLARACAAYRRSGERWYPTPGQLREIARKDEQWRDDATALAGLQKLAVAKPEGPREYASDAEWDAVWERLGKLRRGIAEREHAAKVERDDDARSVLPQMPEAPFDNSLLVNAERPVRKSRAA